MKLAIAGSSGRMGRVLIETVLKTPGCTLAASWLGANARFLPLEPSSTTSVFQS